MANIKVSEMTEATTFTDNDYTMIVQSNSNKKISKSNLLNSVNTTIGDITNLNTSVKTNVVAGINSLVPTLLWTNPSPNSDISSATNINLSSSDYDMLEVFYLQVKSSSGGTMYSSRFKKGYSTRMRIHTLDSANVYRTLTYVSDTEYTITTVYYEGTIATPSQLVIPLYIVGYKTNLFN